MERVYIILDRKQIAALYLSNARLVDIAAKIGVSATAVYRELKRGENTGDDGAPVLDRNQRGAYDPVVDQQTVQESFRRRGRTTAEDEQGGFNGDTV